jgi:D-alanyl-D-alanine dipeptidase
MKTISCLCLAAMVFLLPEGVHAQDVPDKEAVAAHGLPEGFAELSEVAPGIRVELRYHGSDNFVGSPIDGYEKPRCLMTRPCAEALRKANAGLKPFGLGLKVFDAYRPQRAVDHFVRWANDTKDVRMKARYYPDVPKTELIAKGYIAPKSGHSRGSTVDVTIVSLEGGEELDMGTAWDHFGAESWPDSTEVKSQQRANRLLLRTLMAKHGFLPLKEEWWHFTLRDEPFPDTYFDFPIR